MNSVVYTAMARAETAQQRGIGGIYDSICFQTGNVPPPKNDPRMTRNVRETAAVHYTFFFPFRRQQFILHSKKILFQRHGRADIHQTAEQLPLTGCVLPKFPCLRPVFRHFCQQHIVQRANYYQTVHFIPSHGSPPPGLCRGKELGKIS